MSELQECFQHTVKATRFFLQCWTRLFAKCHLPTSTSIQSVNVTQLWFSVSVRVAGMVLVHCECNHLFTLCAETASARFRLKQVFIFLIWHDISVCPVRVCVFILDSSNHYVCHKHSQQQLSDSVFNLVSSSTFHSVHVLNSLGVFSIYCQSYIDGSMSVSQITGMVSVHC